MLSTSLTWVYHIIAGAIAVVLSLSIFYQRLESFFSVHQRLNGEKVAMIIDPCGTQLMHRECENFISFYNNLIFMGRTNRGFKTGVNESYNIYLKSGVRLEMVSGDRFFEVRRVGKRGKEVFFRLYDKQRES